MTVVPVHEILSAIDAEVRNRSPVEAVLGSLDRAKQPLFDCLRNTFDVTAAQTLTLKILNLCLAKYHFLSRSTTLLSRPFGLIVDPSNGCNLACPGCVHSTHVKELRIFDWNKGMLPANRLEAFLRRYGPYAIHLTLCNYGEPLVNPETPRFIRLAKSYLMQTMLSTNLSVGRFDAEAYVQSGLDFMVLSIDGATQKVYEKFRRNGNLDVVYANIRKLVEAKRALGKRTPIIEWQYLAFRHNAHEIPVAIETARRLGVNQFAVRAPFDVSWDDPAIRRASVALTKAEFDWDSENAFIANWNPFPDGLDANTIEREFDTRWIDPAARLPREARDAKPRSGATCNWLYKNLAMDAGGRIFPCCTSPGPELNLTFANFEGAASADPFNSSKHELARLFFADPGAYQIERGARGLDRDPYCVQCTWDKEHANTDRAEIEHYFKAAGQGLFNRETLGILSAW